MSGALDDIVVADFTRILAGPYCTMLLADMGARVIKIERPAGGDDTRGWGPPFDAQGRATYFESVNRNKESVALDLATDRGRKAAREIALSADIVVENFAPGTMARFGLDPNALRSLKPSLIYCSITGFGAGAGADLPGYDPVVQAVGGLMSITGPDAEHPSKVGVALVDVIAGLHAGMGILAALHHRDRTGQGQSVSVNLLQSLLSALANQAQGHVSAGVVPQMLGNQHPSIAPFETFRAADRTVMVCAGNDRQFQALCRTLGAPDLGTDRRFRANRDRVARRDDLVQELAPLIAAWPAADLVDALTRGGVPVGPVNSVAEAFELAEVLGLSPVATLTDPDGTPRPQVASPIDFSATPWSYRTPPPDQPGT